MKKILFLNLLALVLAVIAFAQVPSASPSASPAVAAASFNFMTFIKTYWSQIALALYAALDVLILASPSVAGNGLVHEIFVLLGKAAGQTPPSA